jgi:hypothetical protein
MPTSGSTVGVRFLHRDIAKYRNQPRSKDAANHRRQSAMPCQKLASRSADYRNKTRRCDSPISQFITNSYLGCKWSLVQIQSPRPQKGAEFRKLFGPRALRFCGVRNPAARMQQTNRDSLPRRRRSARPHTTSCDRLRDSGGQRRWRVLCGRRVVSRAKWARVLLKSMANFGRVSPESCCVDRR